MQEIDADDAVEQEETANEYTFLIDRASTRILDDLDEYGPGYMEEQETPLPEADGIVVGDNPSPTLIEAAREYDIPVLDEGGFRDLLQDLEAEE